jgi:molybdopterin-guanine dinucleotide biosynthesis protein A
VHAYILIGGRSRRMGKSKTELFLDRVVAAAAPVFDEVIAVQRYGGDNPSSAFGTFSPHEGRRTLDLALRKFVSPSPLRRGEKVPKADEGFLRTIFEEPHEHEAPVFGIERALRDARDRAFILGVDYPFLTSDALRFLRDDGRVPIWDGRPQALCCVWDASALPRIEERIARGQFDLRGLIDREMIAEAELRARFSGEPLRNVNTPEEWHG